MKLGSLCSGYGGLELGIAQVLDVETAWVSDIDKGACKILAHRFPGVPNIGDMTAVDWRGVEPVDVICGGTPCQDLSHAGRRAGMTEGTRSNLWVAMREAIAVLRPGLVVWENVGGAASAAADSDVEPCPGCVGDGTGVHLRALGRVVGDLSSLGYVGRVRALRAADVGAPHGRLRYFLTAHPAGDTWGLGHRDGGTSADADGGLDISRVPRADLRAVPGGDDRGIAAALLPTPRTSGIRSDELLLNGIAADNRWGDYAAAIHRWETILGRPAPAPTQTSSKGNPQLAPAFVEWMMGLPAGWVTDTPGITRTEALRALGNGVVPQQAAAALRLMAGDEAAA